MIEDSTGKASAVVIQFTNEPRASQTNVGGMVKASIVYFDKDGIEVLRIIGSWRFSDSDEVMFRVDENRQLIVGVLDHNVFMALGQFRQSGHESAHLDPKTVPELKPFEFD